MDAFFGRPFVQGEGTSAGSQESLLLTPVEVFPTAPPGFRQAQCVVPGIEVLGAELYATTSIFVDGEFFVFSDRLYRSMTICSSDTK